ncbi:septal ring lytic transglycosylase RlpA family protein [uncultured Bacteroides sp.]|uniref:septal ring lytic transglycosylase RlpA family protein n=1 Tax=uncultured Bacteroides sp. TaxID=162156 RepID=UPI002AA7C69F|nr:septal ring lytic transglycosylase RlpA family protein [uncultured Bacteroides sp.]
MRKRIYLIICLFIICITHLLGQEVGNATFYHNRFHGHKTSDGGTYHKDSMTCAHKTYPLGTLLKVKNPRNGKEVIVKVTDRGPFNKRLMIDLSYRAAKELEIIRYGIAPVEISPFNAIRIPYRPQQDLALCNILQIAVNQTKYPLPFHR